MAGGRIGRSRMAPAKTRAIQQFADLIESKNLGAARPVLVIDMRLGDYRLVGKLSHRLRHTDVCITRYSQLKGKDFIAAWLQHLLINLHRAANHDIIE